MITFTIDLEDPTERYEPEGRYVSMTRRILDMCDEYKHRATFFAVGRISEVAPHLIKEIVARGHEIAYHSHAHVPLTKEEPERFRQQSRADKDRMEQLSGKSLNGFRAPAFSLTPETIWALDILKELGFTYSSSIMPTHISRYGFPNAPRKPFRWPNGLLELPLPVGDLGPLKVPYLGGIYMYAMPLPLVRRWIKKTNASEILWTYTHPYDVDHEEGFLPHLHGSIIASSVLWIARRVAEKKIRKVLCLSNGVTLGQRVQALTSRDTNS